MAEDQDTSPPPGEFEQPPNNERAAHERRTQEYKLSAHFEVITGSSKTLHNIRKHIVSGKMNTAIFLLLSFVPLVYTAETLSTIGNIGRKAGDALGPIGDALGLIQFAVELIDTPSNTGGTKVQIGVSGQNNPGEDQEGEIRVIWAFDTYNNVLGSSDTDLGQIPAASRGNYVVHQHEQETTQGQYIDVIASDDEICISWILTAQPSGSSEQRVWLGDIGASCGQAWEYSSQTLSGGTNTTYWGKCVWMDTDGGKDIDIDPVAITLRQMKINTFAYGADAQDKGLDYYCSATIVTHDDADPIEARPAGPHARDSLGNSGGMSIDPRSVPQPPRVTEPKKPRPRSQKSTERLIVNSRPEQSAVNLCNSPTSRGSDFVSKNEGLFCDMETKTLYPLCSTDQCTDCFDVDADELQMRKRDSTGLYARDTPPKRYKKIQVVE
ncbi:unnamed protein product [Zymoseptoria tritici ST99CH_3D7]|uniref:Uncharacterized protein n=1 Tax=Zymoseptoria tritici (strain ST99CH_3D7) TaxID=1276538 RepID=A0A1X7RZJ9_ZYMT9|nr:unnamed protein product [Zymoseptoria tritici ST99CH_3D7]